MRPTAKVLEVQERARGPLSPYAKFGGARISPAAGVAKNVACLFVRHSFERQRLYVSAQTTLCYMGTQLPP